MIGPMNGQDHHMEVDYVVTGLALWIVRGGLVSVALGKVLHGRPRTASRSIPLASWDWHAHQTSVGR